MTPCLVQELVGEENDNPVVSGVIFTNNGSSNINVAPTHGEGVVNSKVATDHVYVSPKGVVYQAVADKKTRIVPVFENNKMKLEERDNSPEIAKSASINDEVALNLANMAKFIEGKYGMRMDIEFVYDPTKQTINLVQARAIPEGSKKGLTPSALSSEYVKNNDLSVTKGETITPDIMTASIIREPNEIIVIDDIGKALDRFHKGEKPKALIIKEPAPATSHEAGAFAASGIPVIYSKEPGDIEKQLENNVIVVDPQRSSIFQIPKEEFKDDLIKEGIFVSTLTPYVSATKEISQGPASQAAYETDILNQPQSLGELIIKARTDPEATQILARSADRLIEASTGPSTKDTLTSLESPPITPDTIASHKNAIGLILKEAKNLHSENKISEGTYNNAILSGLELYAITSDNKINDLEYLNSYKKFTGVVGEGGNKGPSNSLLDELKKSEAKEAIKSKYVDRLTGLDPYQTEQFLEHASLSSKILHPDVKRDWQEFALSLYEGKDPAQIEGFNNLVGNIKELGVEQYWLNASFHAEHEKHKNNPQALLASLQGEYEQNKDGIKIVQDSRKIIEKMERQIPKWSDPKQFEKLNEGLKEDLEKLKPLSKELDSKNLLTNALAAQEMNKLVDVVDLSLKKLGTSLEYDSKVEQAKNFGSTLKPFYELMKQNVDYNIMHAYDSHDRREIALSTVQKPIEKILNSSKNVTEESAKHQLLPTPGFSALKANIYLPDYRLLVMWGYETLADVHTVIHQNLLESISRKAKKGGKSLEYLAPEGTNEFIDRLKQNEVNNLPGFSDQIFTPERKKDVLKVSSWVDDNSFFVQYNVPLLAHSCFMDISYNYGTKKTNMKCNFYGPGNTRGNRWERLGKISQTLLPFYSDAKITQTTLTLDNDRLELDINLDNTNLKNPDFASAVSLLISAGDVSNVSGFINSYLYPKIESYRLESNFQNLNYKDKTLAPKDKSDILSSIQDDIEIFKTCAGKALYRYSFKELPKYKELAEWPEYQKLLEEKKAYAEIVGLDQLDIENKKFFLSNAAKTALNALEPDELRSMDFDKKKK